MFASHPVRTGPHLKHDLAEQEEKVSLRIGLHKTVPFFLDFPFMIAFPNTVYTSAFCAGTVTSKRWRVERATQLAIKLTGKNR